jgi:hypothetical protein
VLLEAKAIKPAIAGAVYVNGIKCNGHAYPGNPNYNYADGASATTPRVFKSKGHFKPGGVMYLNGHCFGDKTGRVRLTGNFPGGFVDATVMIWRDDLVVAEIPEGLKAADHEASLQLRTTTAQFSNETKIAFDGIDPPKRRRFPNGIKVISNPQPEPAAPAAAPPPPPAPEPVKWVDHSITASRVDVVSCGNNQGSDSPRGNGGDSCLGGNVRGSSTGVKAAAFNSIAYTLHDFPTKRGGRIGQGAHTSFSTSDRTSPIAGVDIWETRFNKACNLKSQTVNANVGEASPQWDDQEGRSRLTVRWTANKCWSYGNWADTDYSCDVEYEVTDSVISCPEGVNPQ